MDLLKDYFVKLRKLDDRGDLFVTYRLISGKALKKMLKDVSNREFPYHWRVGNRIITWEYPHSFVESMFYQPVSDIESKTLSEVFNFNEFPWQGDY